MKLIYGKGKNKKQCIIYRIERRFTLLISIGADGKTLRKKTEHKNAAEANIAFDKAHIDKLKKGWVPDDPKILARLELPSYKVDVKRPAQVPLPAIMDTSKKHKDLWTLLQKLVEATGRYHKDYEYSLGVPATPKQIAALEKRLGKRLPSTYRMFLELCNGWSNEGGGNAFKEFLSVEDQDLGWVVGRIEDLEGLFEEQELKNPFKEGAIPIRLGEEERVWIALNPKKMEFVEYDLCNQQGRFKTFTQILTRDLATYRSLLKDKKK